MGGNFSKCLVSVLNSNPKPSIINCFGPAEFERCLATPTAHDFCTIIDFLLMNVRRALDRDWVHSLPILHKVMFYSESVSFIHKIIIKIHSLSFQSLLTLEHSLAERSTLIECFATNWDRIRDHLTQVSRLPAYRFYMREANNYTSTFIDIFDSKIGLLVCIIAHQPRRMLSSEYRVTSVFIHCLSITVSVPFLFLFFVKQLYFGIKQSHLLPNSRYDAKKSFLSLHRG